MYTYGPVPSRRLGNSIGVSPIPSKTCSYSCVYCQLGSTTQFTTKRESFFDKEKIINEITERVQNSESDFVTFVGDGEPTLCKDIGWLIRQTQEITELPVAVITNGSLLYREDVQDDLTDANVVMPSIDAGDSSTFRQINRPYKNLEFEELIDGIVDFSDDFKGNIWTETMLVKDYNDDKNSIDKINAIIDKINPQKSFTMIPTRPPAEDISPPEPEQFLYAQKIISGTDAINYIEEGEFDIHNYKNLEEAINEITRRHPLREEQARKIAAYFQGEQLNTLIENRKFVYRKFSRNKYIVPADL